MHDPEKSHFGIVAAKPTNKAGRPAAELVEPRPRTEGNADQRDMYRAQSRIRMTQALDRVRKAARQRCQFASNCDPLFASNRDPSCAWDLGLSM
jgi:hypothetical protein